MTGPVEEVDDGLHLAVEVQYAAAGIPHFWRLELDPLVLVVHRLTGAAYEEVGRFEDEVRVDEPVPLDFRLADLVDEPAR